jgi:hypothetical protein
MAALVTVMREFVEMYLIHVILQKLLIEDGHVAHRTLNCFSLFTRVTSRLQVVGTLPAKFEMRCKPCVQLILFFLN